MAKTLKHLLIALMAVATFGMTACQKDDDTATDGNGNGGNGSGKQLTSITLVEDGLTETKAELHWNGRFLTRVNLFENERGQWSEIGYAQPNYEDSRMTSVLIYNNDDASSFTVSATYAVNKLVSVIARDEELASIDYDANGRPSSITVDGKSLSLQWQGDNITSLTTPDGEHISLSYDQNYFPLNDILALLIPGWTNGMNCPVSFSTSDGEQMDITYRFSGKYPTVATMGRGDESMQIYFNYADGTGETAPAPVALYYIYWYATPWDAGYVEDQDGYSNSERRFRAGDTLTLTAIPNDGYHFSQWSDGNTDNPRTITVTGDAEFVAEFEADGSTPGPTPGPTPGAPSFSVTFGNYTWGTPAIHNFSLATQYDNHFIGILSLYNTDPSGANQYPIVYIDLEYMDNNANYSLSFDANSNSFVGGGRIEYYETTFIQVGDRAFGDWWSKNATVSVTSYDFGTQTFSMTIDATMFNVNNYVDNNLQDIDACETRQLSVTIENASWEYYQATSTAFNRNLNTLRRR